MCRVDVRRATWRRRRLDILDAKIWLCKDKKTSGLGELKRCVSCSDMSLPPARVVRLEGSLNALGTRFGSEKPRPYR